MKKNYVLIPSLLATMLMSGCNKSSYINRKVYSEKSYEDAVKVHDKVKEAQKKDKQTTLFDNGGLYYRYQFTAKGTLRYDDLSFHDVDVKLNAAYTISWSLKDSYLKVEGEKEKHYFIKHDNKYYQLKNYKVGSTDKKVKYDVTSDVEDEGSFNNYFVQTINYYTSICVPFTMNLTAGIDGSLCKIDPLIGETNFDLSADSLFEQEKHDKLEALAKKYKDENKGHSLSLTYGIDNDTSTCVTLKGKGNANDFHQTQYRQGEVNFDIFASFKDNFISQVELKLDSNTLNLRDFNLNMDINMYMSEEVNKDTCKVDEYNFSEYNDPEE